MSTSFGGTDHSSPVAMAANYVFASIYTCPIDGTASTGHAYTQGSLGVSVNVRLAVFAVSGGVPAALIGSSNHLNVPQFDPIGIKDFTFGTPVPLSAGVQYALGAHFDTGGPSIFAGSGTLYYAIDPWSDGTSSFVVAGTSAAGAMGITLDVDATSPGGGGGGGSSGTTTPPYPSQFVDRRGIWYGIERRDLWYHGF